MKELRTERRRLRRLCSVVLMVTMAACLVTPRAHAQPSPPSASELAEAKKFFDAGLALKKDGLYKEALASFLEANRRAPRESVQNDIALTYRLMKDMASAFDAYEVLLSTYGGTMKPRLKTEAQHAIEALDVLTGTVAVGVQEPGARVVVDDKDVGLTPLVKPVRLNIGAHQMTITKDGFEPLTRAIQIQGHDSIPFNGPLVKTVLTGHVVIDVKQTTPPDPTVRVYVDATDSGAPPYAGDLEPGMHTLEAHGDKTATPPQRIQVDRNGTYAQTLQLHVQAGTVVVEVDVTDSEIAIDGAVVAHGVYEGPATAGTHVLRVTKAGYPKYENAFILHDGDRIVESVRLQGGAQAAAPHDWKGVYSHLEFVGQFEVTRPTNDIAQGVGYGPTTPVSGSSIFGGGLDVRVGYSFGFIGIEGTVLLGYDHSSMNVTVAASESTSAHPGPTPRTEDYEFSRLGGTAALGVRLMPKTRVARPTLGVAGGVSLKGIFYTRTIQSQAAGLTGSYTEPSNPAFYPAPSLMVDAGVELGSTPGTKFYLGCLMVADFAGATPINTSATDPNFPAPPGGINGVNGTDVFVGPILGMQFGE
jgi:hypothetical protein